jgi:acetoin utilization protein AcuA
VNTLPLPFYPTFQETAVSSPRGQLCICTGCSPEFLHPLVLEDGIGRFARYRSIIAGVTTREKVAALPDANVTVALSPERRIIGYIECSYPDAIEGWRGNTDGLCYELGAIEVSRNWRHVGIGKAMVAAILTDPFIETKIFFLTGYCWHWDTDHSGLSVYAYRNMLMRLFRPFGFRVYLTNNPEIRMASANVLMARIGTQVNPQQRERFQQMLFTFDP